MRSPATTLTLLVTVAVLVAALGSPASATALRLAGVPEFPDPLSADRASDIGPILDEVSGERLFATIDSLSSYWTRCAGEPGNLWAADYIMGRIEELGYEEAYFDSFWCDATGGTERNIVFTKQGTASLEGYVVVGAHFDCTSGGEPDARSPGADDNASGIAGLLEIAQIVEDLPLLRDVVFVCYNVEEVGMLGSEHFVQELVAAGDSVFVCLNVDCIGYTDGSWEASIEDRPHYRSLARAIAGLMSDYTSITPRIMWSRPSDNWPFMEAGIPAIMIWEEPLNPLINGPEDWMEHLNQDYAEDMTRANLAALLATAELEGTYLPIAPVTFLEETCATEALGLPPGAHAEFRWW
ncbi:MAG: M28 family peptidase, partial [Candidatus Eisenbacteria sp.]|nr:M28 family peptidase [Candidatus Eisenbacteria bacterium]